MLTAQTVAARASLRFPRRFLRMVVTGLALWAGAAPHAAAAESNGSFLAPTVEAAVAHLETMMTGENNSRQCENNTQDCCLECIEQAKKDGKFLPSFKWNWRCWTVSPQGSRIDTLLQNHMHFAADYQVQSPLGVAGCAPCGGGG